MNKTELISKYNHHLSLKNCSENTLRSYLNGLLIFLDFIKVYNIEKVTGSVLESFFHHAKKEMGYSYSMMS